MHKKQQKMTRYHRTIRVAALACLLTLWSGTITAAETGQVYRWSGKAEMSIWSDPANWDVRSGEDNRWSEAARPPGAGDQVHFTDTVADAPQHIELDRNISIGSIVISATGANRDFTLASGDFPEDPRTPDSGAGRLFTLTLTDEHPVRQSRAATRGLRFALETHLVHDGPVRITLDAAAPATVVIDHRTFRVDGPLTLVGGGAQGRGMLVLREPITVPSLALAENALLLLDPKPAGFLPETRRRALISGPLLGDDGVVLLKRNARMVNPLHIRGTLRFQTYEADEAVLTFNTD